MDLWIHVDLKCLAPSVESLLQDLTAWKEQGATGVVIEWENTFPYPGFEDALRPDAYTRAEVATILGRCRSLGLTTMPLVQTFGHLEWFLSIPKYARLREFPDRPALIRACDEESWGIIGRWIDALLEAHADSPYIHLGADEARGIAQIERSGCSARQEGVSGIFLRHMKPILEKVIRTGKRPIIWADMVLRHPEHVRDFPRELVFCDWMYSQTAEVAPSVPCWDLGQVSAANYAAIPEWARAAFEKYWRISAPDFPAQFYQTPYLPFLRDAGYDVIGAPATLWAGHSLACPSLPTARANGRTWLRAAHRHGALGVINTCWTVRGALRETTNIGHQAFLMAGRALPNMPEDNDISVACWKDAAVAEAVDRLDPPLDDFSRTKPLAFDAVERTLRPNPPFDQRWPVLQARMPTQPEDYPHIAICRNARERAAEARAALAPWVATGTQAAAWDMAAVEVDLRAACWLVARDKSLGRPLTVKADDLAAQIVAQADRVENFMKGRYRPGELRVVRQDRYESLLRFAALMK